jgi:hypothetical protein
MQIRLLKRRTSLKIKTMDKVQKKKKKEGVFTYLYTIVRTNRDEFICPIWDFLSAAHKNILTIHLFPSANPCTSSASVRTSNITETETVSVFLLLIEVSFGLSNVHFELFRENKALCPAVLQIFLTA